MTLLVNLLPYSQALNVGEVRWYYQANCQYDTLCYFAKSNRAKVML